MSDEIYALTELDHDRIASVVNQVELERGVGFGPDEMLGGHYDVIVEVTGTRIAITTTTRTTTTSSTTSSSTTSTTSTTTISTKYLYPGKVVYRKFDTTVDQKWWTQADNDIYIQEVNNESLEVGSQYSAHFIGTYGGRGVFGVQVSSGAAEVELCEVTGAFTSVSGVDYYPAIVKRLDRDGGGAGIAGWITKVSVWLVQRYNAPMSVGFAAMAKRVPAENLIPTKTIASDTRMVYYTSDMEWCPPVTTTSTTSTTSTSSTSTTTTTSRIINEH